MTNYNGRKAKSWRTRRHLAGGGSTLADAEPLRPILWELKSRMSWTAVALLCGTTSHRHVADIARGHHARVNHDLAAAIRAASGQTLTVGKQHVDALGARRRTQALYALGYSKPKIAALVGYGETNLKALMAGRVDVIHAATDRRIREGYERHCMKIPAPVDTYDQGSITRAQRTARAQGWVVPLAWNDIDDPNEIPTGWQWIADDRAAALRDLAALGVAATEAAKRLHVNRDALEVWCRRKGLVDVWRELADRERQGENQWTEGAA